MSGISDSVARLSRMRSMFRAGGVLPSSAHLSIIADFGSNPRAAGGEGPRSERPRPGIASRRGASWLHTNAEGYDRGSGWSQLAETAGFALLYPEQQRSNNANLCFNWFEREDVRRGQGEVLSIRQMIATMVSRYDLDPARVYVTGLSAGGAMTSALLAAYPDVFA